jgi:hypothetical protein
MKSISCAAVLLLMGFGCSSARLQVVSEPSGAKVYVNDIAQGSTPVNIDYGKLPYENVLTLKVQKENYGTVTAYIEGPKQATLGQKVTLKIAKQPDEITEVNREVDRIFAAHKLAMDHRFHEALLVADQLIIEHPDFISAHVLRGSICFYSKNYNESRISYKRVLELDASNGEATKMLKYLDDRHLQGGEADRVLSSNEPAIDANAAEGVQ